MSGLKDEVIKIFYAIRKFLGIVQYNATNGLNVAGTPVSYESVTYSQFMDSGFDVATERTVHVSDKHSTRDGTSEPGSFWRIIPSAASTYKRQLISEPIYSATLAAALDPTLHPGVKGYIASFQDDVVSDGSRYDPCGSFVVLKNMQDQVSTSTNLETEWYPISIEIPRDVNGKSLLRDWGYLALHNIWWNKTGTDNTTDNLRALVRFGTNNSSADLAIVDASATNVTRWIRGMELKRTSSTTIQYRGDGSTVNTSGPTTVTHSSNSTIHDMDAGATYINVGARITKTGGSVAATSIVIRDCEIRLHKPGAA